MNMKTILKNLDRIDADSIEDKKAAKRVAKLQAKRKQGGFTLLELLVVVAILAAIAGTATIALQDTDARAAAAAHVAMMDELNKGIRTFRVLNKNVLPNNFDSLLRADGAGATGATAVLLANGDGELLGIGDVEVGPLVTDAQDRLNDIGMTQLRYISDQVVPDDSVATVEDCSTDATIQALIRSRSNAVVAGNIFNGAAGHGCGLSLNMIAGIQVAYWTGTVERVLGPSDWGTAAYDGTAMTGAALTADVAAPILMTVGIGPASNLFNANELGGMTSVPIYRHVAADQYPRFIALFQVGESTWDGGAWSTPITVDQISLAAIVDGAGDTKEEELGEWDGTRNTI